MRVAVLNFSGNVGKTTIARHLLAPRIPGAEVLSVETINADDQQVDSLKGSDFGHLQEWLQTVSSAVVDIGASNVEDLLALMRRYKGSHDDFEYFVVPTVPALKQQTDTIATLMELRRIGVPGNRVRVLFNQVDGDDEAAVARAFGPVCEYLEKTQDVPFSLSAAISTNEVFELIKGTDSTLETLAQPGVDLKAQIFAANKAGEKDEAARLARELSKQRLASGILPDLDKAFSALQLAA